jgi:rod shape-determining protein MreB
MNENQVGQETLHIGIDLGTSRSAIAASNGTTSWVKSYVGWPKDFVSAKSLGQEVLLGDDAINNRLSLDVYRPLGQGVLKEGMEKSADAVKEIITHLIGLARPAPGQKVQAIIGVPAEALKVNKLAIMVSKAMVVSEPFAVAYGMDLLDNALIIDIGAGTVDFCIMHGSMPEEGDQKTILTAGDYVDNQLFGFLTEKYPESGFTENMVTRFKEKYAFVGSVDGEIKVELPVNGKPFMHDIKDEVRRACEPEEGQEHRAGRRRKQDKEHRRPHSARPPRVRTLQGGHGRGPALFGRNRRHAPCQGHAGQVLGTARQILTTYVRRAPKPSLQA